MHRVAAVVAGAVVILPAGLFVAHLYAPAVVFAPAIGGAVAVRLAAPADGSSVVTGAASGLTVGLPGGYLLGALFVVSGVEPAPQIGWAELLAIPLKSPFVFFLFLVIAGWCGLLGAVGGLGAQLFDEWRSRSDRAEE